jgi:acetyltransferase-like isoleucine patch superfamily enzyme
MNIGKYTYGNDNIKVKNWGHNNVISIGNFCSIAENVTIFLGGNHRVDWVTTFPFGHLFTNEFNNFNGSGCPKSNGNVIIGNDVWIGTGATIMSGVTIGDGAVIAANSHVVKNVEPYSIVGGNPAELIRLRFTTDQINKLLEIKWWFWDNEKINKYVSLLCDANIDNFINAVSEI